ncbi:MAG: PrsW family intramembrane metalloprotease [Woeseiaceae bacterium]
MSVDFMLHAVLGLLPVCCFLAALMYLDSYKLIPMRWILGTIALGCVAVIISYPINAIALKWLNIEFVSYSRYVAPFIEEALKALVIFALMRRNRIGFLVDAAIFGFAVGTGFAIFENLFYLQVLPNTQLGTWIVRGFGTAFMHGGTTAIFAIVSHTLIGQHPNYGRLALIPGFVIAVVVHSIFNHFFFAPIVNTLLVLVSLPILLTVVFQQSEHSVSEWLGMGFDADTELIELINSGELSTSHVGLYLHSLKEKFEGPIVVDLLCYLRLHTELSIRAKGLLMMRETGFVNKTGEETKAKLEELKFLESSIGTTGLLAMKPFLQMSQKDLWQLYMLSD